MLGERLELAVKNLVKKLSLAIVLSIILIGVFTHPYCFFTRASPESGSLPSDRPVVYIDPPVIQAGIGEYITVSVKVFNLTNNWKVVDPVLKIRHWIGNLFGLELKLSWDPTILNYTSHVVKIPVEVYSDGVLHGDSSVTEPLYGMYWVKNNVNVTAGTYELAVSSMINPTPFNNPGRSNTILTMTFKVIGYGSSLITLDFTELAALHDPNQPFVSTVIYHHPKWPYPGFVSDAYHMFPGAPVAKFTMFPADAAVVGKPVLFDARGSETSDRSLVIRRYLWDFGDGTFLNVTEPIVTHSFAHAGTYTIKLMVVDNSTIPLRSAPLAKTLTVVSLREVVVKSYRASDDVLLLGASLKITVVVKNEGAWDESIVLKAYYNRTMQEWAEISNATVNLRSGDELSVELMWDTSLGPSVEGYYAIMVNITTVIPHEGNVSNNFVPRPGVPPVIVFLTSQLIYDMAVESLKVVTIGREGVEFSSPFIVKESLVISALVARKGTYYETFNATIKVVHSNGTVLGSRVWSLQTLGTGNRSVVLTYTFSTAGLTTGYCNVSVRVVNSNVTNAELDVNKTNNVKSMLVKVVEPPVLKVSKPDAIYVNDTVTFSAAESIHVGGNFTKYTWNVYEGINRRTDLSGVSFDPYWSVRFDRSGRWKVVLIVEDDNGLTYNEGRPLSAAYRLEVSVDVSARVGPWLPMELVLALVLIVGVIVGSVVYLKRRRGGKPPS